MSWNRFVTGLRRRYGAVEFFRAVEVQQRGALHLHVPLRSAVPIDRAEVQALALAAGFGCRVDLDVLAPGHAAYVAKYVTKAGDERARVPWRQLVRVDEPVDVVTGEIRSQMRRLRTRPTYRAWSCSAGWGLTMRAIEAEQLQFCRDREEVLRRLPPARVRTSWDELVDQVLNDDSPPG